MSKIFITADIHINDYPSKNPTEKYRLYQSRYVAQNIIAKGKKEGCDYIAFAGDVLERAINRPYILAEVKLFFDTIMKEFKCGWIIWGNHDQDNKGNDQSEIDSSLYVMLPPNLYYADKREVVIDNSRIAFSNWYPKFDLSWINGCVDLLITHATIDYSGGTDHFLKSQNKEFDQSKFNLAICGDIHRMAQSGKFVSIGVPQKCKMGDSDDASGVVYDCVDKTWKWVNLNPFDNLMKHKYTSDLDQVGWNELEKTWYQYQASNVISNSSGVNEIQIPVWDDINNLINDIISCNGLQSLHTTILEFLNKNVEYKEVDFNFTLRKLKCENWRSIDSCEIYFEEGDKILIQGKNGSGKSSLLSAIKYALIEYPGSLKDFIQFGCKSCLTELTFLYQGSVYKISRGFKSGKPLFGLEINDNPQKYNNKKEFDEDIHIRFPFIDYMDLYFFNSDHSRLIGDSEIKKHPERLAEYISKFFKLDKIDAYNDTALRIKGDIERSKEEFETKKKDSEIRLRSIESDLSSIVLPSDTKEDLIKYREEGLEKEKAAREWKNYKEKVIPLENRISIYTGDIRGIEEKLQTLRSPREIENDISEINSKLEEIDKEIISLGNSEVLYKQAVSELEEILKKGREIRGEIDNLGRNNICPTCKRPLSSLEDLEVHKKELMDILEETGRKYREKESKVREMKAIKDSSDSRLNDLGREKRNLQSALNTLNLEFGEGHRLVEEKERKQKSIENLVSELESLKKPEEVILPENFTKIMMELESYIGVWEHYELKNRERIEENEKINFYNQKLQELSLGMNELDSYIKLTGSTGKIYEEIMGRLAKQFTDNDVKYEVESYNFKRKDHLALKCYYNNNGNNVPYDTCSDGQKTVLDIHFLSRIVTRMGLLVMDEFLKHLDPGNHELCIGKIQEMNIGCILLSSHMESVGGFNNRTCNLSLNDSGLTNICIK